MSFRDNLQHLRATRGMTQEQLAMLLGVSRQSVTKWEAERATPEMDKLLAICRIFDCSLDELVTGDLTGRAAEPAASMPASAAPTDVCGYDDHWRGFAFRIATGVAAIILGVALAVLAGSWTEHVGSGAYLGYHPISGEGGMALSLDGLATLPVFVGVIVGLALLIPAAVGHSAFKKAHPFVQDFYAVEDRQRGAQRFGVGIAAGVGCILAGVAVFGVFEEAAGGAAATTLLTLIAAGVWLIIHAGLYWSARLNVEDYNLEAGGELTHEDIRALGLDEERTRKLLAHRERGRKTGIACAVIMMAATVIALLWFFLGAGGGLMSDDMASMFWVPWPIGGIGCGIAAVVIGAREDAKRPGE